MSKLMAYFNEVDRNAVVRAAHQSHPIASMSDFGLSAEEQNAIMSGKFEQLAAAVGVPVDRLPALIIPQTIGTMN